MLQLKTISKKTASARKNMISKSISYSCFDNFNNLIKEEKFGPYFWVVTLKTIKHPG